MDRTRVLQESMTINTNQRWMMPFNACTFFNFDTTNSVTINQFVIPAAVASGGHVYPTFLEISLNQNEVNDTYYDIKFTKGGTTNNLLILYSIYSQGLNSANP